MPRVRDLLYRFRPAGAPGAAGSAGVPSERATTSTAELAAVFAQFEPVDRECADIIARAVQSAAAVRSGGAQQAQAIITAARERAAAHAAQAATRVRQRGADDAAAVLAAAQQDAERTHRRGAEQIPRYVEQVVASVCGLLDAEARSTGLQTGAP